MSERKPKVLTVDDEQFNLDILRTDLEEAGYDVLCAADGLIALDMLKSHTDVDLIVLDRMMPNMDGMQVTKKLKGDPQYRHIPIIMQTAAGQSQQVREGLQAGVYYYLIKPYNEELLLSIIRTALRDTVNHRSIQEKLLGQRKVLGLMERANFRFRTLQDVSNVAYYVASCCPNPEGVVYGLSELMINAVEHGNLGISYADKMDLVLENRWQHEVERRLGLPENAQKYAHLFFETTPEVITITIRDQGNGFKWQSYLDFDPVRMATDPHGKGIAMTKVTSFPDMEYRSGGTEVICRVANGQPG